MANGMKVRDALAPRLEACVSSRGNDDCVACGSGDSYDDDQILFCDECDRGYHQSCHAPTVTTIPKTDWFCASCKRLKDDMRRAVDRIPRRQRPMVQGGGSVAASGAADTATAAARSATSQQQQQQLIDEATAVSQHATAALAARRAEEMQHPAPPKQLPAGATAEQRLAHEKRVAYLVSHSLTFPSLHEL